MNKYIQTDIQLYRYIYLHTNHMYVFTYKNYTHAYGYVFVNYTHIHI